MDEDQNAYDAVMTAVVNSDLSKEKLGRIFAREIGVSRRAVKRGQSMRKEMEDMDSKRWIRRTSRVPKNAIGVGKFAIIYAYIHMDVCISYIYTY